METGFRWGFAPEDKQGRERDDVRRFARALADAFKSMTDSMELAGILIRSDQASILQVYIDELERLGYGVRKFTERRNAVDWVGTD